MNRRKKILACLLMAAMATGTAACDSSNSDEIDNKATSITAEITPTQVPEISDPKLTEDETTLGITLGKKNEFIDQYDQKTYDTALPYIVKYLHFNLNSEVDESKFDVYRKDYDVQDVTIISTRDEHNIPGEYITIDGDVNRDTVIFVHGQGSTRLSNMTVADYFLKAGFNILTFDLPSSGENQAKFTTFGAFDKYDVLDCVDYVDEKIDDSHKLIVWGCSYGGNVTSVTLGEDKANEKIDTAIIDCPLPSMEIALKGGGVSDNGLDCCDKFLSFFYGFDLEDADGTIAIQDTKVPVLVVTSKADTVIPYRIAERIFTAVKSDNKELYEFEDVAHTTGCTTHPKEYIDLVKKFLKAH